jgi:hypothetical protein
MGSVQAELTGGDVARIFDRTRNVRPSDRSLGAVGFEGDVWAFRSSTANRPDPPR